MQWTRGQKHLIQPIAKRNDMAVTFPDNIHPKYKLRVRFDYFTRPMQYLEYFKIITKLHEYKFIPLNLCFNDYQELNEFLVNKGIVFKEIDVSSFDSQLSNEVYIVDTAKIYDVENCIGKYLNNYKYYSINEVAEMLSFSRPTVYKWLNDKSLKAVRINGQLRIKHLDLMTFMNRENE